MILLLNDKWAHVSCIGKELWSKIDKPTLQSFKK